MASLAKHIPKPPFFFRIYAEDGQGIMYKADKKLDPDTYDCPGSRKIGITRDGVKIWQIGGYSDVMPVASMHQIVDPSIHPLSKSENDHFVDINKLDPALKKQHLYFDGISFWFVEKGRGRSRTRSRSRSGNRTGKANSKGARAKSKTRGRSKSGK
jgi:hypothetical protein